MFRWRWQLASGEVKFDVLLSTVPLLQPAKKFGRQLGRAMPSVKRGTAGEDVASLVREHLAGMYVAACVFLCLSVLHAVCVCVCVRLSVG